MQNFMRKVVAGPRSRHPESNLDLCYVTDNIIATSGPSSTYPQRAYRNPLDELVAFLDKHHGEDWSIWEFRAEGTGYPDSKVYNRIKHFPWPDHHPPPFELIPSIMASMRNWLHPTDDATKKRLQQRTKNGGKGRVAVMHCKAGKGRTGTTTCSYLMSEEGWKKDDALRRFTERRMRPNFGNGVSIPSQLRWVDYVDRWVQHGKVYVEQTVEVVEVHVWGLRDGVKLAIEGYVEHDGPWKIKTFHVFDKKERDDLDEKGRTKKTNSATVSRASSRASSIKSTIAGATMIKGAASEHIPTAKHHGEEHSADFSPSTYPAHPALSPETKSNVIFRPSKPISLPTNDINLAVERRAGALQGWTMVTSVGHVWFNTFFEGNGPENYAASRKKHALSDATSADDVPGAPWADSSGVFQIEWEAMDGIKGSKRKGAMCFDKVAVVWKVSSIIPEDKTCQSSYKDDSSTEIGTRQPRGRPRAPSVVVAEPGPGQEVRGGIAAAWQGVDGHHPEDSDQAVASRREGGAGMGTSLGPRQASESASRDPSINRDASRDEKSLTERLRHGKDNGDAGDSGSDEDGVQGINRGVVGA